MTVIGFFAPVVMRYESRKIEIFHFSLHKALVKKINILGRGRISIEPKYASSPPGGAMNTKRNHSPLICSSLRNCRNHINFFPLHCVQFLQEMNNSSIVLENHGCLEQVFLLIRCTCVCTHTRACAPLTPLEIQASS